MASIRSGVKKSVSHTVLSHQWKNKQNKMQVRQKSKYQSGRSIFHPELARVIFSLLSGPVFLAWIFHEFGRIPFNSLMKL